MVPDLTQRSNQTTTLLVIPQSIALKNRNQVKFQKNATISVTKFIYSDADEKENGVAKSTAFPIRLGFKISPREKIFLNLKIARE